MADALRIIVVAAKDEDPTLVELNNLPAEASIVVIGRNLEEMLAQVTYEDISTAKVLFCATGTKAKRDTIEPIVRAMPNLVWIQSITTGLDHFLYDDLRNNDKICITNSKMIFSPQIAEFVIASILYFAKDFPRLIRQKEQMIWERFPSPLLCNQSIGIIGYGEIGRAIASLAKGFHMHVMASRRSPALSADDPLLDEVYSSSEYATIVSKADYLVIAAPLTPDTENLINADLLKHSKPGQVLINVGRGKIIVEADLIEALENGVLKGAALDVFSPEPLPTSSKLWTLPNVIISPHNAYQADGIRNQAMRLFCENCRRFLNGETLPDLVDKRRGY